MKQKIAQRSVQAVIVLIGVVLLTFVMLRIVPGNPIETMMWGACGCRYRGTHDRGDGAGPAAAPAIFPVSLLRGPRGFRDQLFPWEARYAFDTERF